MERQAGIRFNKESISIIFIILFYIVGIAGFYLTATQTAFIKIVPWFILLMTGFICLNHEPVNYKFVLFAFIIILLGYAAEWKGVNKHTLFGQYSYGETLGIKYDDVPLIIGFNWLLTVYAMGVFMRYVFEGYASVRIIVGSLMMVLLDIFIEPVAVKFGFWHWDIIGQLTAPRSNFIDWFVLSLVMLTVYELFQFKKQNKVGVVLLLSQFVFFIALHWAQLSTGH